MIELYLHIPIDYLLQIIKVIREYQRAVSLRVNGFLNSTEYSINCPVYNK